MTEVGRVLSVNSNAAVVAMRVSAACEKCGLCLASSDGREVLLLALNDIGASQGDTVEIEISPGRVLVAAFALYLLPVLMTILGFIIGSAISGGDEESILPIALSVGLLIVSFLAVWTYDLRARKKERREATVTKILTDDEASPRISVVQFGG